MRRLAALVALSLAALLVLPAVRADGDWGDGERQTDTNVRSDGFEITSDRLQGAEHDRISFSLDAAGVEIHFDFLGDATASNAEAGVRIRLGRIVEFRDQNGDGAFQSSDEVRAEYHPDDLALAGITAANLTSNGVPGVQVTAAYTFRDAPNSTFGLRATTFSGPTTFENLPLQPVQTKIDVLLGSFPYRENGTLPAVELRLESEVEGSPVPGNGGVVFPAGSLNASFGWKSVALVDGVEQPVHATVALNEISANETEAVVAFAYARGATIVHDPTVGFAQLALPVVPAIVGNPLFYALGAGAAATLFALLAVGRRGRKAKGR